MSSPTTQTKHSVPLTSEEQESFELFNRRARSEGMIEATEAEWRNPDALTSRYDAFQRDRLLTELRPLVRFKTTQDLIELVPKLIQLSRHDKQAVAKLCLEHATDLYLRDAVLITTGVCEEFSTRNRARGIPAPLAELLKSSEELASNLLRQGKLARDRHDQIHIIGMLARTLAGGGPCLPDILLGIVEPLFLRPPRTTKKKIDYLHEHDRIDAEASVDTHRVFYRLETARSFPELLHLGSMLLDLVRRNPLQIERFSDNHCTDPYLHFTLTAFVCSPLQTDEVLDTFLAYSDAQADSCLANDQISPDRWRFVRTTSVLCRALATWLIPGDFQSIARSTVAPLFLTGNREVSNGD